ncbi:MAG TPA: DUF971 domain-containing protein [Patescibacteria group bacterium]|nr:DUF971 domain-containing protein [Patescibacteria group bacterium]
MEQAASRSTKPTQVKVHVSTGAGMDIDWADGHHSHYEFAYLRDRCPCAVCKEGRDPHDHPAPAGALPLYKPRITARSASPVGHYAVEFDFSDGHATGIFSFPYLREICPCGECGGAK